MSYENDVNREDFEGGYPSHREEEEQDRDALGVAELGQPQGAAVRKLYGSLKAR